MIDNKKIVQILFVCLILFFSVSLVLLPWWRIWTSKISDINSTIRIEAEYKLPNFASASQINKENENQSIYTNFSLNELDGPPENKDAIISFFNYVWILAMIGSALNILAVILFLISIFLKEEKIRSLTQKYLRYPLLIGGLVCLISALYFGLEFNAFISNLENVVPNQIAKVPGKNIEGFFGTTVVNVSNLNLEVLYGPAAGWYLAFGIFFLDISLYFLLKTKKYSPAQSLK